ncbi:MAG: glutamate mutase L, partial [Nocardioidaceae bacterium]
RDLRKVRLLVASGGVLRNGGAGLAARVLSTATGLVPGGWQLPEAPRVSVDDDCVLAAAGLLARSHPAVAYALLARLRDPASTTRAAARRASGEA